MVQCPLASMETRCPGTVIQSYRQTLKRLLRQLQRWAMVPALNCGTLETWDARRASCADMVGNRIPQQYEKTTRPNAPMPELLASVPEGAFRQHDNLR